ncbi:hypothetical protein MTO96_005933 [Rhipicephalus appendiculatus]
MGAKSFGRALLPEKHKPRDAVNLQECIDTRAALLKRLVAVRREHTWVILLVRIVANIVCAMVLESAFVDPDLLDPVQCLAAVMVVFAGALTTLHLLVEGQENSPLVASHRFLQLFT